MAPSPWRIEDTEPVYVRMDFANAVPGGGVLGMGAVRCARWGP